MISKLLSFLPSWWPIVAIGLVLAVVSGGLALLKHSWQSEATTEQSLQDATKVIGQKQTDSKTSATLIEKRDATLTQRDALVVPVQKRIDSAPDTSDCPIVICVDAGDGVRVLIEGYRPRRPSTGLVSPN